MNVMVDERTTALQPSAADFDQQLEALVRKIARGDASPEDRSLYAELTLRKSLRMTPPRRKSA
jgi:hypothetical protein